VFYFLNINLNLLSATDVFKIISTINWTIFIGWRSGLFGSFGKLFITKKQGKGKSKGARTVSAKFGGKLHTMRTFGKGCP